MITISITTGTDEGPPPLAAFDCALLDAGVANYDIILPTSWIQRGCYEPPADDGDRLYLVMARWHPRSVHWQSRPIKARAGKKGWQP